MANHWHPTPIEIRPSIWTQLSLAAVTLVVFAVTILTVAL